MVEEWINSLAEEDQKDAEAVIQEEEEDTYLDPDDRNDDMSWFERLGKEANEDLQDRNFTAPRVWKEHTGYMRKLRWCPTRTTDMRYQQMDEEAESTFPLL
jgi:hypothetical protein